MKELLSKAVCKRCYAAAVEQQAYKSLVRVVWDDKVEDKWNHSREVYCGFPQCRFRVEQVVSVDKEWITRRFPLRGMKAEAIMLDEMAHFDEAEESNL